MTETARESLGESGRPAGGLWSLLRPLVTGFYPKLAALFVFGLVELAITIYLPLQNKTLIEALESKDRSAFVSATVVLVALAVLHLVVSTSYRFSSGRFGELLHSGLRRKVARSILHVPLGFFQSFAVGDLISRTTSDTEVLKGYFSKVALQLLYDALALVAVAAILFAMDAKLALITVASVPLSMTLGRLFHAPIRSSANVVRVRTGELMAQMQGWLARPLSIKAHLLEPIAERAFATKDEELRRASVGLALREAGATGLAMAVLASPSILVFALGGAMTLAGELSIGSLVAFTAYASYFQAPMQRAIEVLLVTLPGMLAARARLVEVFDATREGPASPVDAGPIARLVAKDLRLEITNGNVIGVPDLRAARGEVIGIVGPNGCGKTSLLTALLDLRPIAAGQAWIELEGGGKVALDRRLCSALPQDSVILDGSLRDNLTLFDAQPDAQRLRGIVSALGMGWIEALPDGLDTWLDAGSLSQLSGGQLQQIGLARAVYRQAPVMILDEPGTSLDAAGLQRAVALIDQQRDRALIVVSHRQEVLTLCDRVYELLAIPEAGDLRFELRQDMRGEPSRLASAAATPAVAQSR